MHRGETERPDADCVRPSLTERVRSQLGASGSSLDLIGRQGGVGIGASGHHLTRGVSAASRWRLMYIVKLRQHVAVDV
jgi:hypothetical protein